MNELEKYFFKPKKAEDMKDSAKVVLDTNILLAAYQWKETSFGVVIDILKRLTEEKRLVIPEHVVKEFMNNRPSVINSLIQEVDKNISSKLPKPKSLESVFPALDLVERDIFKAENDFLEARKEYVEHLKNLKERLKTFINDDPILDELQPIIEESYYKIDLSHKEIEDDAKIREKGKVPPLTGGDSFKKTNKYGDLIIWKHILSIQSNIIFITADFKRDWAITDPHGNFVSERRELTEEFYEKEGKTFCIAPLDKLVEMLAPTAQKEVIMDLQKRLEYKSSETDKEESEKSKSYHVVKDVMTTIFLNVDPLGLYSLSKLEDEYDSEINALMERLTLINSEEELYNNIQYVNKSYTTEDTPPDKLKYLAKTLWPLVEQYNEY